jgi:hypothetical protein
MQSKRLRGTIAIASCCALVGAAGGIAGSSAANKNTTGSTGAQSGTTGATGKSGKAGHRGPRGGLRGGRHVGANGQVEKALSADVAAKVKAAALAKVDGTVIRTETDADHGSPYEAHVRKADGTEVEVLVNSSFEVTAVNAMPAHGPGGPPPAGAPAPQGYGA